MDADDGMPRLPVPAGKTARRQIGAVAGPGSKTGVAPGDRSAKTRGADIGLGLRDGDRTGRHQEPTCSIIPCHLGASDASSTHLLRFGCLELASPVPKTGRSGGWWSPRGASPCRKAGADPFQLVRILDPNVSFQIRKRSSNKHGRDWEN